MSETEFTNQVLTLAKLLGWRTAHFRPARTKEGWRTAVAGDGKGFPDLMLLRDNPPGMIVAELKVGKNVTSAEQEEWLQAFEALGVEVHVWHPDDWDAIKEALGA